MAESSAVQTSEWNLSAQEAAAAMDGRLQLFGSHGLSDSNLKGIGTDTRVDLSGLLFFALKGESHDAHAYLKNAIEKNCGGLVVHRALTPDEEKACEERAKASGLPVAVIVVKDTLVALQQLSRHWRHKCRAMILGITGTNGKTSTKEFAAALLSTRFKVQWSKGSFNNHWGVPLSLLSIQPDHDVAVIEMGMNHPGELKTLSKLADADAVVCTMVGRGHLEGVGSIEGAARAKAEIYEHAPAQATFIFNLDNEHTNRMMGEFATEGRRVVTFGEGAGDVCFRVVAMTADSLEIEGVIKGLEGRASIPVFGRHNVTNLLAAASLALVAGMSPQEIWRALPECRSAWGRNQWVKLKSGARALFDGYNANPESMRAALENSRWLLTPPTGGVPAFRRSIAVLGEMRELGDQAPALHEEMGRIARASGFDEIIFVGPSYESVRRGYEAEAATGDAGSSSGSSESPVPMAAKRVFAPTYDAAIAKTLASHLGDGDYVLIKGSRGMSLEVFLEELSPIDFKKK